MKIKDLEGNKWDWRGPCPVKDCEGEVYVNLEGESDDRGPFTYISDAKFTCGHEEGKLTVREHDRLHDWALDDLSREEQDQRDAAYWDHVNHQIDVRRGK